MTKDVHVLCEGFHDRDFLAGWFEYACGWQGAGAKPVTEFAGEQLPRGAFVFTRDQTRVCITPVDGREQLRKRLGKWLLEIRTLGAPRFARLIVVADGDHLPADGLDPVRDLVRQEMHRVGCELGKGPPWSVTQGLDIEPVALAAGPQDLPGVPERECLERLVAAAFAIAWPERFSALVNWLRSRPDAREDAVAKTVNWSIMASWFADGGCADFLRRAIWNDKATRQALDRLLERTRLPQIRRWLEAP